MSAFAKRDSDARTVFKEVCAERFTLVDAHGGVRATLETVNGVFGSTETVLALFAADGSLRLTLRASEHGAMMHVFGGREAKGKKPRPGDVIERLQIGYEPQYGDSRHLPCVKLFDGDESERLSLEIPRDGGAAVYLMGDDGAQTAIGDEGLVVWGDDGEIITECHAPQKEDAREGGDDDESEE